MTLATYQGLKDLLDEYLGQTLFTGNYDDLIKLFEASACRRLQVRETIDTATITMSSGVGSLPADFLTAKSVTWTGSPPVVLDYVKPEALTETYGDLDGVPRQYTIIGDTIKVGPLSDTSLSMIYVQRTAAVSGTLNWLFTKHPDAYVFGSLCEAEAFGVNDERAALWKLRRDEVFREIEMLDFNYRAPMSVRVVGVTP